MIGNTDEYHIATNTNDLKKINEEVSFKSGNELLMKTKMRSLVKPNKIYSIKDDEPLEDAVSLMTEHKVRSLPVWNKKTKKYTMFLDLLDVVTYINKNMIDKFSKKFNEEAFKQTTVNQVASIQKRAKYYPVDLNAPLMHALEQMCKHNIHRIPIIEEEGDFSDIFSQTDMIKFLSTNRRFFQDLFKKKLKDLFKPKTVLIIGRTDKLIDAFLIMFVNQVSAVGVVDKQGKLVGKVSGSDLKALDFKKKDFSNLFVPVEKCLASTNHFDNMIHIKMEDELGEVIDQIVERGVHRVFVVDSDKKPIVNISLNDILLKFKEFVENSDK